MSVVTRAASKLKFQSGDVLMQTDFEDLHDSFLFGGEDNELAAMQGLGSGIKMQTLGARSPGWVNGLIGLSDSEQYFMGMSQLNLPATLTGVKFYQHIQGVFTGDNTNSIALYGYSAGSLTKVAESANDANIWKGAATTWQTVAFASAYAAPAGVYYVAILYNYSAQTTQPVLGRIDNSVAGVIQTFDLTNSAKLHCLGTGKLTQTTPIAMSTLSTSTARIYLVVY